MTNTENKTFGWAALTDTQRATVEANTAHLRREFIGTYRIERVPGGGGVAVYWRNAASTPANAIRLFATTDQARAWVRAR